MISYGTLAGANAYHEMLGNSAWGLTAPSPMPDPAPEDPGWHTDAERSSALLRATRAFDGRYGRLFPGAKLDPSQRLSWPRIGAWDQCSETFVLDGTVPEAIVEAVYELALVELLAPGSLSISVTPGRITASESVDVISRSFFNPAEIAGLSGRGLLDAFRPSLSLVEDLLSCYLKKQELWTARVV